MARAHTVFPTLVGVFPGLRYVISITRRLPHARGGVSSSLRLPKPIISLPHARGGVSGTPSSATNLTQVFPTLVGVFLMDAPRCYLEVESSPRSWGCFQVNDTFIDKWFVFPTLVGVFPGVRRAAQKKGGSSPRSWGCFWYHAPVLALRQVFPTLVGVFQGFLSPLVSSEVFPTLVGVFPNGGYLK